MSETVHGNIRSYVSDVYRHLLEQNRELRETRLIRQRTHSTPDAIGQCRGLRWKAKRRKVRR